MYFVINYKEYCEVMGEAYDKDNIPAWFTRVQKTAIQAIRKEITDTSIFPVNNAMLHQLKKRWLPQVIEGIAKQIFYTYNNEYFLNNGVFANRSYNQTQYGEGPVNREDYLNAVNTICTPAQNALLGTGWLCKKADIVFDKSKYYIVYNPTYKEVNWGSLGGVIEEQTDLMDYLADNYTAINDFLTFKSATNLSLTNLETNIESVEEVAESKQEALSGLSTYAAGRYLKVVNNGTTEEQDLEIQWVDLGSIVQENLIQWDDTTKELFKGETGKYTIVDDILLGDTTVLNRIKEKSTVTASAAGTATDEVSYITIDGTEKKIAGGISESQVDAKILVETNRAETAEQEISEAIVAEQTERLDSEATLQSNIDKKQDTISDLSTIRSNAEKGATAVQPAALDNYYTKDETDSEIDTKISQSVGRYITSSTAGANFATKAVLTSGPYYYNGETVTLIATDYAIVAADEDHDNAQTRYIYTGSQWNYQYTISTTITAAQQAALDSGINTTKVAQITTNTTAISTETTERKEAVEACEKTSNKTTSITTGSTDTEYPSAKAVFTAIDEVYNDLDGRVEAIESEYTTTTYVNTQVSTEATARQNADTTLQSNIDKCEKTANKVTSLSSESTDTQYPTAKCVYDLVGNIETILTTLNTGTGAK